jgi:hypothetical protein
MQLLSKWALLIKYVKLLNLYAYSNFIVVLVFLRKR